MKKLEMKNDVKLICVTAKSFPDGILEAFQTLEKLHPSLCERTFYGISTPNNKGVIIYKAAVPEFFEGEGAKYGCETFVLPAGEYLTETVVDFMKNTGLIKESFDRLLQDHRLDENYPCIERYEGKNDVICMVKIRRPVKQQ